MLTNVKENPLRKNFAMPSSAAARIISGVIFISRSQGFAKSTGEYQSQPSKKPAIVTTRTWT